MSSIFFRRVIRASNNIRNKQEIRLFRRKMALDGILWAFWLIKILV